MERKNGPSASTPINNHFDCNNRDNREADPFKRQNHLRNSAISNKWSPSKPINSTKNGTYQFESSGSVFKQFTDLKKVFKEDSPKFSNDSYDRVTAAEADTTMSFKNLGKDPFSPRRFEHFNNNNSNMGEESDDNDNPNMKNTFKFSSHKRRTLAPLTKFTSNDSPRSLNSSRHSGDETFLRDSTKLSSTMLQKAAALEDNDGDNNYSFQNNTSYVKSPLIQKSYTWSENQQTKGAADMDFIMLISLFIGLLISKALQYLQLFCCWFLYQVMLFRNALLGTTSIWDFLNMEDSSRFHQKTKILLLPLVFLCTLLYGLISVLYFSVRFMLTTAPHGLINFIQKLHN